MELYPSLIDSQATRSTREGQTFSCLTAWQPFFLGFFFIILFEMLALSLVLFRANQYVAVAHLVVSAAGLWWLGKSYVAVKQNPTRLNEDKVFLSAGPFLNLEVPLTEILSVELKSPLRDLPAECVSLVPIAEPEVIVTFKKQREISSRLFKRRMASQIGLTFDDSAKFVQSMASRVN